LDPLPILSTEDVLLKQDHSKARSQQQGQHDDNYDLPRVQIVAPCEGVHMLIHGLAALVVWPSFVAPNPGIGFG
jgi:hypothetical protein